MKLVLLDANILIRYLTADDPLKQKKVEALFLKIKKKEVVAFVFDIIFAEVVFVLASPNLYHLPKVKIRSLLLPFVNLPNLKFQSKKDIKRALDLLVEHNLDFEDALLIAYSERKKIPTIFSFDRDFEKISTVKRAEPE